MHFYDCTTSIGQKYRPGFTGSSALENIQDAVGVRISSQAQDPLPSPCAC